MKENNMTSEREVSKSEFKKVFFEHLGDGWTEEYWNQFYENEENNKYFVSEPQSVKQNRMMISYGNKSSRIFFLTEDAEESFFDYPGKK